MTKKPLSPEVLALWHPEKNSSVDISKLSGGSGYKAWWLCALNHDFPAVIRDVSGGHGCPYCAGNKVWQGFNDLATTHPGLASEWHANKNGDLKPTEVSFGSKVKVWWTGKCGHDFFSSIGLRAVSNHGCPYCAGQKILIGFNDLGTTHPEIAAQWHPTQNGNLTPQDFTSGTNKKVWWKGTCGHDFMAAVSEKIRSGEKGCPYCSGKSILKGFNDLGSLFPDIAQEWDPDNGDSVYDISAKSTKVVKWICPSGHSYKNQVRARTQQGADCNYCSGKRILPGVSDIGTTHPHLLPEWDYVKNGDKLPEHFSKSSHERIWWLCTSKEKHSYEMPIESRTKFAAGCNICSNRVLQKGFNDLATKYPNLALQWHPELNENLTPDMILASFREKVWWKCPKNHEWEVSPLSRIRGDQITQCPICQSKLFASKAEKELTSILRSLGIKVLTNRRNIIKGMELDLYLPDYNVAIEYHGLYWHSELGGKDRKYHLNKYQKCQDNGIALIQIWEDNWLEKKELIIRQLAYRFKKNAELKALYPSISDEWFEKHHARKLFPDTISGKDAAQFLDEAHIQGSVQGSFYYGLKTSDEKLVAVLVMAKTGKDGEMLLSRYATKGLVVGGFTKLLKYAVGQCNPQRVVTFSDHSNFDGKLYELSGFTKEATLREDYMYVKGKKRYHKFGFRLAKFKNDPNLMYEENMTERDLAILNGYTRIWDSGKTRWVLEPS